MLPITALVAALAASPGCIDDLEGWPGRFEQSAAELRGQLALEVGLALPELPLEVDFTRVHEVELGGPAGTERVLEVHLVGPERTDARRDAASAVQVFYRGPDSTWCVADKSGRALAEVWIDADRPAFAGTTRQRPLTIGFDALVAPGVLALRVEALTGYDAEIEELATELSYWKVDDAGALSPLFGPVVTHNRRLNGESMIPFVEHKTRVALDDRTWPARIRVDDWVEVLRIDERKPKRHHSQTTWELIEGTYRTRMRRYWP